MRVYDLAMTHQLDADDFFIHRVQQHCAERGLNFFLIEPLWAASFLEKLASGEVWTKVLLNMHSEHHEPADVYHRLIHLAAEKKTQVIDPPVVALASFNKAKLHPRLAAAGINVPPTIIVPREQADAFQLSDADRALLAEIIGRIAKLTDMNFFSTEIAQSETGEFVVIDYVNDQCHLLTQSVSPHNGVPDELVAAIARRLVEAARQMIRP